MRESVRYTVCPDPEQLAAFVEGGLGADERTVTVDHLDGCPECREIVASAMTALPSWHSAPPAWRLPLAAAAALMVAVCGYLVWLQWRPRTHLEGLVAAVGTTRLTEARPTGGFAWGPVSATRGTSTTAPWKVLAEVARVEEAAQQSMAPADLRALATAHLLVGKAAEAIAILEAASARGADDALLLSDLSAAYLERARQESRADDLVRALDAAERAVAAEPQQHEALFNRALALERLNLRERAVAAWTAYLHVDNTSPWATEARERRARLSTAASRARDDLQPVRERLAHVLLPAWGEAQLARKPERADRATEVVAALAGLSGSGTDAFDEALARHWRSHEGATDVTARAHVLYAEAYRMYDADRLSAARPLFEESAGLFAQARSPFGLWPRFYLALDLYYAGRLAEADRLLGELERASDAHQFRSVGSRVSWIRALIAAVSNNFSDAARRYRSALARAEGARNAENAAVLQSLLGEALHAMGRRREAWDAWSNALARLDDIRMARRRQHVFLSASMAGREARLRRAAFVFQEALAHYEARPVGRVEQEIHRGRMLVHLGELRRGADLLHEAEGHWATLDDPSQRRRLEAELRLAQAELALATHPPTDAETAFATTVSAFESVGNPAMAVEARLGMARARAAAGDATAAAAMLGTALQAVLDRLSGATEREKVTLLNRARPVARELAGLRASQDPVAALAGWEAFISSTVDPGARSVPRTPPQVQGVSAFVFLALDDRLLRFRVRGGRVGVTRYPVGRDNLARQVRGLRFAVANQVPPAAYAALARELFEVLLGDQYRALPDDEPVVLVPDDVLEGLPFGALVDSRSGAFAIELRPLSVAPALTFAAAAPAGYEVRAVVAGNPALDPADDLQLRPLPGAEREAREVAAILRAEPLLGEAVSRERLVSELRGATVLHFAGHAVRRGRTGPELLLAPSVSHGAQHFAAWDAEWRSALAGLRLAVISACSSAVDAQEEDGTAIGLARPFLVAGVPTVIGTLWDVEDDAARDLMVAFHRGVRQGLRVSEALRGAQRMAIARQEKPRWAAFQVIGGG